MLLEELVDEAGCAVAGLVRLRSQAMRRLRGLARDEDSLKEALRLAGLDDLTGPNPEESLRALESFARGRGA